MNALVRETESKAFFALRPEYVFEISTTATAFLRMFLSLKRFFKKFADVMKTQKFLVPMQACAVISSRYGGNYFIITSSCCSKRTSGELPQKMSQSIIDLLCIFDGLVTLV